MRGEKTIKLQASLLAAVASVAFAYPAYAQQSSETFVLQPSAPNTSTPSAQGPVDAQNPVVRPSDTEPPASAPSAAPAPVPTIAAPPPPLETGGTTAPARRPAARPQAVGPQVPVVAPPGSVAAPSPALTGEASVPTEPDVTATQPAVAPATETATAELSWWWALVPLGAAGLGAFLWLRRRRAVDDTEEYAGDWAEPDEAPEAAVPPPVAAPSPTAVPPKPSRPERPPSPAFGVVPAAPAIARERKPQREALAESKHELIEVEFEPIGLRVSLVYATLQYRMTLRANADRPAGHLVGDMISAHASLPQNEQLAPAPETLLLLKAVPAMEAGETSTLQGDIQLPLNAVRPLRKGNASYLVPLIRLYVVGDGTAQLRRVYTVGIVGAGAALLPIRLDTGSRTVTGLAAREVEMARHIPLAQRPQRAAG